MGVGKEHLRNVGFLLRVKNILKFFCSEGSFNDWNILKVTELYTELDELYGTQISSQ